MMVTTYDLEFQPPAGRSDDSDICYFLKRKGRKHFEVLKQELPVLKEVEEVSQEQTPPKDDADEIHKALEDAQFKQLLFRSEWTGIGLFGRLLEPKMIPLNMTPTEETKLWKMYEETKICGTVNDAEKTEDNEEKQRNEIREENEQVVKEPLSQKEIKEYEEFELKLQQNYKKYEKDKCIAFG